MIKPMIIAIYLQKKQSQAAMSLMKPTFHDNWNNKISYFQ
jgi:hypothetical protein